VVKSTVDLAALRDTISSPRLDACRRLPSDDDLTLLGRYAWNVALSEALYPILQSPRDRVAEWYSPFGSRAPFAHVLAFLDD